ncbi:MAG: phosphatidylserine decarboxylase family protein [Candidatus Tectomicrobia bacterium]|uniref:Phosphatidylserine decarboxylase proenzyme n=1 Tax=Tectimicrobiota bacterium TaxID=2528274 RepID=A0A932CQT8_UNCTE|nr:phosphatidylserine decarboxylase family protein [Candidatus Tectomicrobia bacterium]
MTGENRLRIAKEGFPYILGLLGVGGLFYLFHLGLAAGVCLALAAFVAFFFRDPVRLVPQQANAILSPADGKVVAIRKIEESDLPHKEAFCISIFLSLFDVHINRSPYAGRVVRTHYHAGRFLPAFQEKASLLNEQNSIWIEHEGFQIKVTQIAGLIARRIACWVKEGDTLYPGDKLGLIKFGSRVDIFLPPNCQILVEMGDKIKGGETVIAEVLPWPER